MKKAFLFLASAALLLAGCAKVEKEDIVPTPESGKRIVTLNAGVDNSGTRVSVDELNGNYSWQAGEEISVLINNTKLTKSSATNVSGNSAKFQVELESGESIGDYAYSPADATWWNASNSIGLATSHDYVEGATFMPMLGTISADKKSISFKAVGGVIKLTISNIPSNAESLVFSAYGKRITGTFAISGEKITAQDKTGNDNVTINFAGKQSSTMAFFIPVPTGTYSGFELQFYAAGNTAIAGAGKKVQFGGSGLTVNRSEVIIAPELPLTKYYTKVTSNDELGDGYYLIVYEGGSVAFNGGLETLDKSSNNIAVTISNNRIESNATTDAARFYIGFDGTNATIQSESGYYIGQDKDENGLKSSKDEQYINTISFDADGNANIVSAGGGYLRYNATSGQERFRYFKSSTYTNQKAIALYKLSTTTTPKALDHITLSGDYPTQFYVDDTFSYEGLTVTAHFDDGTSTVVTPTSVSTPDLRHVASSVPVTVSYTYRDITKNATYNISVVERPVYTVTLADDNSTLTTSSDGSVTLPSRTVTVEGYTFEGWSETNITEATTETPEIIPIGSYTPTANITLYPVYSSGEDITAWVRTELSQVSAGNYILLTEQDYPFSGKISGGDGQVDGAPKINFNELGWATSIPNKACVIKFIPASGGFRMYSEGKGYLYAKKAASGNLAWGDNDDSYWLFESDNWKYKANGAYLRSYNDSSFRTYGQNNGKLLKLAKQTTITLKTYISNPS